LADSGKSIEPPATDQDQQEVQKVLADFPVEGLFQDSLFVGFSNPRRLQRSSQLWQLPEAIIESVQFVNQLGSPTTRLTDS
jgi:hypothetical protein